MPSDTFLRFVQQLNARGREKADGFDRSHFDGLTPEERPEVARLLHDALTRGDSTAVGGLMLLDPDRAPDDIRDAIRRLPPENGARVTAAGTLLARSPDGALQAELVEALASSAPFTRRLALNYLTRSAPNRTLVPALRARVREETDGANRALGAELLLYWSGAVARLEESYRRYGRVLDTLETGEAGRVARALDELDRALAASET